MSGLPIVPRVLGVDFGRARIGVAISDELGMLAHPLETIPGARIDAAAQRVAELAREKNVERVILGLPRHMNGELGVAAEEANCICGQIAEAPPLPRRDVGRTPNDHGRQSRLARVRTKNAAHAAGGRSGGGADDSARLSRSRTGPPRVMPRAE